MNRFLRVAAYLLALYLIETLLCILCYETEYLVHALQNHGFIDWNYRQALRDALEMNIFRMLAFYAITLVVLYFGLKGSWKYRALQAAVLNCGTYLLLCALCYWLLPEDLTSWFRHFARYAAPATFISPFIAQAFHRLRKLTDPAPTKTALP